MTSNKKSHDDDFLDFSKLEKEVQNAVVNEERYWCENDAKIRAVEQRVPTYDDFRSPQQRMTSNKKSHDDDFLDFSKLEKEVQNAVVNEERYWCENDAKIRAVEQRVPTYDDFRSPQQRMTSNKKSHDDDFLDFSKLEKEVQNAVVNEERYWCENDAKIRAVEQRVPTYDDFREIVLAAHLKPLEKKDKISSIGRFTQVWNQSAQKCSKTSQEKNVPANSSDQEHGKQNKDSVAEIPKSGKEFILQWNHCCKTLEDKKQFLFTIGAKGIAEIFRIEIAGDLLGEFLECVLCLEDSEIQQTVEVLEALTKSQRFSLSLAFLSKKEQELCKLLFEKLKGNICVQNSNSISERLANLESIYCRNNKG